ncbi:MAG: hypothetical protein ACRDHF_15585 [Tepidiformaceae bacterium]
MSRLTDAVLAVGKALDRAFGWETPLPRLNEAEVLRIARATAQEQGWTWTETESVWVGFTPGSCRGGGVWRVMTNANYMGGNITLHISDETGAVLHKGFAPY